VSAQVAQQPVLTQGEAFGELLERVEGAVVVDEPNDVAVQAAGDVDEARRLPFLQRQVPGQVAEVRLAGSGQQSERDAGRR
jgi:hypothetical protein